MWRDSLLAAYVERFHLWPYVEEFLVRAQRPLSWITLAIVVITRLARRRRDDDIHSEKRCSDEVWLQEIGDHHDLGSAKSDLNLV
jgi:hypothetical protein